MLVLILGVPLYRLLIWGVLILVFGSVATKIKWGSFGEVAHVISAQYPSGAETPAPRFESTDARRDRLKSEAIAAGKTALANVCNVAAVQTFRDALISLARQRMRDMGCVSDMLCNIENGFKEVSFKLYASDADRQISKLYYAAMNAGAIPLGSLGTYQIFVGHPEELSGLNSITMGIDNHCPAPTATVN